MRSLTVVGLRKLLEELPEHLANMAVFSVATGLRQGNVKGLEWRTVDRDRRHAWIPAASTRTGNRTRCR